MCAHWLSSTRLAVQCMEQLHFLHTNQPTNRQPAHTHKGWQQLSFSSVSPTSRTATQLDVLPACLQVVEFRHMALPNKDNYKYSLWYVALIGFACQSMAQVLLCLQYASTDYFEDVDWVLNRSHSLDCMRYMHARLIWHACTVGQGL